ncbi:MAG: alpha/beta hydrolase [Desulfobacterales bacterium]|nr:alpha/beta hydrolase [Desulfobacterales bacterium]
MQYEISFQSKGSKDIIEGIFNKISRARGVVLTHPHPQYGGDMMNPILKCIEDMYIKKEYSTLKFNFRGVGKSTGEYDNGIGEQQDVVAAIAYLVNMAALRQVDLVGYSFGAFVSARVGTRNSRLKNLILISPPLTQFNFEPMDPIPGLKFVITGSKDDVAPAELIREAIPKWNSDAQLKVIEGADHFYSGCTDELQSVVEELLNSMEQKK